MPRIASRLRKARVHEESVQIVRDPKSTARSEDSKKSRGHDERGNYGKSTPHPDSSDHYDDKV